MTSSTDGGISGVVWRSSSAGGEGVFDDDSGASVPTVYNVRSYGATGDGTTDDSTAVLAAIQAAYNAGGGTVYFPMTAAAYRINSNLTIPNDGQSVPSQPPITLLGDQPLQVNTNNLSPASYLDVKGSRLDLRSTTGPAKIDTRGQGILTLKNLMFTQQGSSADTNPFVQTTNTAIVVEGCGFFGHDSLSGTSCVQTGIVLGGGSGTQDGTATGTFRGYGTCIDKNVFCKVWRGVLLQAGANSTVITRNVWTKNSGGDKAQNSACIEILTSADQAKGNVIAYNIFEGVNYLYGVYSHGTNSSAEQLIANSFWDSADATAYLYQLNNANDTVILGGYAPTGGGIVNDTGAGYSAITGFGLKRRYSRKTANYTITNRDSLLIYDGSSLTATLPVAAASLRGYSFTIKNNNATDLTVATQSSQTIDGASGATLKQWECRTYFTDGSNWFTQHGTPSVAPSGTVVTKARSTDSAAVNNSTTPVADDTLTFALEANSVYVFHGVIFYDAATAADFKLGWNVPSGASGHWITDGVNTGATTADPTSVKRGELSITSTSSTGGTGAGTVISCRPAGIIRTGATAGSFTLTYAQQTADGSDAFLRADSFLVLTKV